MFGQHEMPDEAVEHRLSQRAQRDNEVDGVRAYGRTLSAALETLGAQNGERGRAIELLAHTTDAHEIETAITIATRATITVEECLRTFDRLMPPFVCDSMHGAFVAAVDELLQLWRAEIQAMLGSLTAIPNGPAGDGASAPRAKGNFAGWWAFFQSEVQFLPQEHPDLVSAWQLTQTARAVIDDMVEI
jgi:hypothetical protein